MKVYSLSHILERLRADSPARFLERVWTTIRVNLRDLAWDSYFGLLRLKHPDGFCLRDVQGSRMYLDLRDKGITRELFFKGIREVDATRFTLEILQPGQTVYDIGANIGYYAIPEARRVGPAGKIIAVEPVPGNVKLLRRNIEVNELKNIELHECAIGDVEGTCPMYVTDKSNWSSMHKSQYANIVRTINVPVHPLDAFLIGKPAPDFIRMDVEGYELQILKGMKGLLDSKRPLRMFIEVHPHIMKPEDVTEFFRLLKDAGIEVEKFYGKFPFTGTDIAGLMANESFINGQCGAAHIFFRRR